MCNCQYNVLSVFEPDGLSDRWRLLWICCSFCTLADILRNNDLMPLKCVYCRSFRSLLKYNVICFSLKYYHDKYESQDLTWALCFALCCLWISCFIVLSASVCLHGCIRFLDLPLKELLVGLSICRKLDERAACWTLVRGSFVFLLLSATLVFTLTHRNSGLVSVTFVKPALCWHKSTLQLIRLLETRS